MYLRRSAPIRHTYLLSLQRELKKNIYEAIEHQ